MEKLRIRGAATLRGTIRASGAKNASLPLLAATLLTDEPVVLHHLPDVRDIRTMSRLLEHLGVEIEVLERGDRGVSLRLQAGANGQPTEDAPYDLVKTMRASVLVLGPRMARHGRARVSLPGGCAIGVRPVDQHLAGLEALGATVDLEHGYVEATCAGLPDDRVRGARFRFAMPTVGGTENVMMAATLARGSTVLENCAREPEIVDLAELLTAMGACIAGAGTSTIEIEGVDRLHGAEHEVMPDRIEAGTYLIGSAMTGGDVTVEGTRPADLLPLLDKLEEAGCSVERAEAAVRVRANGSLRPCAVVTEPHPGFPTDLQAQFLALMTRAEGTSAITETVFENRFQHVPELSRMGASIRVERKTTALVQGPSSLSGASVMATDLRASASLVLAGLAAEGETIVDRIYHLDRGYSGLERKLATLGADVERFDTPYP
ncbi:MAG: UDP-N-acetylglucosamine 1-carboxyvinyltransferase [Acidobacteriota bacterium]